MGKIQPITRLDNFLGKAAGLSGMEALIPKTWKEYCINKIANDSGKANIIKARPKPYFVFGEPVVNGQNVEFVGSNDPDIPYTIVNGSLEVLLDDEDIMHYEEPIAITITGRFSEEVLNYNKEATISSGGDIVWGDPLFNEPSIYIKYSPSNTMMAIHFKDDEASFGSDTIPVTITIGEPSDTTFLLDIDASPVQISQDYNNSIPTFININWSDAYDETESYNFPLTLAMAGSGGATVLFNLVMMIDGHVQSMLINGEEESGGETFWALQLISEAPPTPDEPFVINFTPTAQDFSGTCDKSKAEILAAVQAGKQIWARTTAVFQGHTLNAPVNLINVGEGTAVCSVYIVYDTGSGAYLLDFVFGSTADYTYAVNTFILQTPT